MACARTADEASRVATRMRYFGIDIAIRRLDAVAPKGGIQSWARINATILTSIARETGAVLLLAHHEADQAETVFMRLSRGSGLGGLCGMGSTRCLADIPVLRPLLEWRPDELMMVCRILAAALRMIQVTKIAGLNGFGCGSLGMPSGSGKDMAAGLIRLSAAARAICCSVDAVLADQLDLPELFAEGYAVFSLAAFARYQMICGGGWLAGR